ncbi:MAG: ATP-binding protein [Elusimicrobiales bacterium]|nr:ATP-binding protein [Elusimicrobiales bacterium]MCK5582712.1 ATP-binding protein [Elusimicrobiales bacterium]
MIKRTLSKKILESLKSFPIVVITGPRQSGKTTLVKNLFPKSPYFSLEDIDMREFASEDPRKFLEHEKGPIIIDEIQRVPDLLSYMQTLVDKKKKMGMFLITGSNNLMLLESISQTLAGRAAILTLLPCSLKETMEFKTAPAKLDNLLFKGFYPAIYDRPVPPGQWYSSYITTYLERDVRRVINVGDLNRFQRFVKMCAARSGQILNLSSLGNDCGISHNTAKTWLSALEASYILYLIYPHYKNFNKRLIKSPKLYFYDTGLLCYLLGINEAKNLSINQYRGQIFETWVIGELLKYRFNKGLRENIFFWRDHIGQEIDCIIENGENLIPLEIKSGTTVNSDFFKGIKFWSKLAKPSSAYLVYGGDQSLKKTIVDVLGWKDFALKTIKKIFA